MCDARQADVGFCLHASGPISRPFAKIQRKKTAKILRKRIDNQNPPVHNGQTTARQSPTSKGWFMIKRVRSGFLVLIYDRMGRRVPEVCELFESEKAARAYLAIVGWTIATLA